ncbi:MAG: C2H2-type zinc finger protein [Nitrososphaerales archaeon]
MITIRVDELSESQLAEIALAIQNRWDTPALVKMHEIIVDDEEIDQNSRDITQPLDMETFQQGFSVILENLELMGAFSLECEGKSKLRLKLVDGSKIPSWIKDLSKSRTPEGVYECPHCGKWFSTEFELNLHRNLHYII